MSEYYEYEQDNADDYAQDEWYYQHYRSPREIEEEDEFWDDELYTEEETEED